MTWWLTLLVASVGASGGVIGGWLSGRIGSRATLRAVREERAARARADYLVALGAFHHAAALMVLATTELPPERNPTRIDKIFAVYPQRFAGWLLSYLISERQRAFFTKHPILVRFTRQYQRWNVTLGWTESPEYAQALVRRLDTFLETSS